MSRPIPGVSTPYTPLTFIYTPPLPFQIPRYNPASQGQTAPPTGEISQMSQAACNIKFITCDTSALNETGDVAKSTANHNVPSMPHVFEKKLPISLRKQMTCNNIE